VKKDKLHKIKSTGFKTPEHYFGSFEDQLFERLEEQTPINGVNETGFEVPKDYFDNLEDTILGKLNVEDKPVVKLNERKTFYYVAGIAASLIILLAIFLNKTDETISVDMVETYFENSDLDSYELAQLFSESEVIEDDFTIAEIPFDEESLESYLLENADIESILE